ncbi:YfjI family protein [Pseudocitrobacter faecalis]|nr:YfjI family protein [Pseudocitrobacter faecalis]
MGHLYRGKTKFTSLQINNARLTISFLWFSLKGSAIYMKRYGEATRGSGFSVFACMICYPTSTRGIVFERSCISSEHIPVFHNRLRYLLKKYIVHSNKVICLRFSPEAETAWIEYFNYVESKIKPHHAIFNIKDSASKMMENVARTAALLHFFEYEGTEIGADTIHFCNENKSMVY